MRKDPSANLPYAINWADWLTNEDDTLATADWTVPAGLVKGDEEIAAGVTKDGDTVPNAKAIVWLSGGTAGTTYRVSCRLTTAGGRVDDRSLSIYVMDR